jgi:hypothetical protein
MKNPLSIRTNTIFRRSHATAGFNAFEHGSALHHYSAKLFSQKPGGLSGERFTDKKFGSMVISGGIRQFPGHTWDKLITDQSSVFRTIGELPARVRAHPFRLVIRAIVVHAIPIPKKPVQVLPVGMGFTELVIRLDSPSDQLMILVYMTWIGL